MFCSINILFLYYLNIVLKYIKNDIIFNRFNICLSSIYLNDCEAYYLLLFTYYLK